MKTVCIRTRPLEPPISVLCSFFPQQTALSYSSQNSQIYGFARQFIRSQRPLFENIHCICWISSVPQLLNWTFYRVLTELNYRNTCFHTCNDRNYDVLTIWKRFNTFSDFFSVYFRSGTRRKRIFLFVGFALRGARQ